MLDQPTRPITIPRRPGAAGTPLRQEPITRPGPSASPSPSPVRRRRTRRSPLAVLLPIHLGQVVVWQLAVLASIMVWMRSGGTYAVVVVELAALIVLATSVRVGDLCGYEWLSTWISFRRSRATHPELDLRTHTDRLGNRTGIAGLGGTWSAAIRLRESGPVDMARLVGVLNDYFAHSEVPLVGAQLAVRTAPYWPTQGRAIWLAVRFDPDFGVQATLARGDGELGALRATASAVHRLAQLLEDAGLPGKVLDERSLFEQLSLVAAAGDAGSPGNTADPAATGIPGGAAGQVGPGGPIGANETRETWQSWTVGGWTQRCFRPAFGAHPTLLLDRYVMRAAFTCVSYTLHRRPRNRIGTQVLVRIGGSDGKPREIGVPLDALNGRHAAAYRATLPLALGPGGAR